LDDLIGDNVKFEHAYFESEPGVFLHYAASGPLNAPVMVFLHGFPEFWFTWSHLLKDFSKTHRCYALDQRGYNISSKPANLADYAGAKLVGDVERFVKFVVGGEKKPCIIVAHDWGAAVAWQVAHACNVCTKLIILDMPHVSTFQKALQTSTSQKRRSMYILYFQLPFLADALLSDPAKGVVGTIVTSLSPSHRAAFCRAAAQPGAMTAALNYYRAAFGLPSAKWIRKTIDVPVLQIMGANSTPFDLKSVNLDIGKYVKQLKQVSLQDSGHWIQHDRPQEVIKLIRDFLAA